MKKTYISPAVDITGCLPSELMIGAMDMSDPTFQNPTNPSNEILFDENEDFIVHQPNIDLWEE